MKSRREYKESEGYAKAREEGEGYDVVGIGSCPPLVCPWEDDIRFCFRKSRGASDDDEVARRPEGRVRLRETLAGPSSGREGGVSLTGGSSVSATATWGAAASKTSTIESSRTREHTAAVEGRSSSCHSTHVFLSYHLPPTTWLSLIVRTGEYGDVVHG